MDIYTVSVILITTLPFLIGFSLNFPSWASLLPLFTISGLSFLLTLHLIPSIKQMTKSSGLSGRDLNKPTSKEM